jgi:uncharacterized integral membrane protein (TIGR00697 family)
MMSLKTVDIFDFTVNLGIVPFISIFTVSNIIIQKKGILEVKNFILNILLTSTLAYIILLLVSKMDSSSINLFASKSFDNIFINSARIYFANIVTMLYMLYFNSILYYYLKKEKNKIWISNSISTIIIQFFATIIFVLLSYAITTDIKEIIEMMLIRYILSIIISLLATVTIYINNSTKEK